MITTIKTRKWQNFNYGIFRCKISCHHYTVSQYHAIVIHSIKSTNSTMPDTVAMATKFDTNGYKYNSACIGNIAEMLVPRSVFSGMAVELCQTNSTTTDPVATAAKFHTKTAITQLV